MLFKYCLTVFAIAQKLKRIGLLPRVVIAWVVGDVEERFSSKNQLDDKALRLTRYMYMISSSNNALLNT